MIAHNIYPEIQTLDLYIHILSLRKDELTEELLVGQSQEGLPLSGAQKADTGGTAWVRIVDDSHQCLGHNKKLQ